SCPSSIDLMPATVIHAKFLFVYIALSHSDSCLSLTMLPLLCESLCWVQGPGQRERRKRSVVVRWVCGWSPLGLYFFHPDIHAPPRPQSMVKDGGFEVKPASLNFQTYAAVLT